MLLSGKEMTHGSVMQIASEEVATIPFSSHFNTTKYDQDACGPQNSILRWPERKSWIDGRNQFGFHSEMRTYLSGLKVPISPWLKSRWDLRRSEVAVELFPQKQLRKAVTRQSICFSWANSLVTR